MFNKKEILTNEILERIEKLRVTKKKEFSKLMPGYTAELFTDPEKANTILNKMKNIGRVIYDYDKMEEIISNLKWTLFTKEFEPYKNEYGILYTRIEMFFELEFFDLPLDDQVNITLVEIFNGYSEKGSKNESFLGLCHFGFFDYKPMYAQTKRSLLVKLAQDKGVNLPILFDRDIKTRKFLKDYHKKYDTLDFYGKVRYFLITQSGGWYPTTNWYQYFERLKKEA